MLFLQRKHPPKKRKIFFETFAQNHHNCLQYEKVLKIFIQVKIVIT
jgi:hypothetical protein